MPRKSPKRKSNRLHSANPIRAVIWIDGSAVRKKFTKDYEKARRDLQQSRVQLDRFIATDQPQFSRWLNSHFGALLTELRELSRQLMEDESLIYLVETEAFLTGDSYARAYREVTQARDNPEPPFDEHEASEHDQQSSGSESASDHGGSGNGSKKKGGDPFEAFFEDLFGPADSNDSDEPGWAEPGPAGARRQRSEDPGSKSPGVKELYRALVRQLHPDRLQEMTPQKTEWWHQAQKAYQAGDAEQLEVILTLCAIGEAGTTAQTSVSLLQRITAQVKSSLRQLKQELAEARRNPAWNFSNRTDLAELASQTRRTLTQDRDQLRFKAQQYRATIAKWQAAADRLKRPRRRKRQTHDSDCPF